MKEKSIKKENVVFIATLTVFFSCVVYVIAGIIHTVFIQPTLNDLRYTIKSEQVVRKVEVKEVIREKNKEPMYKINYGPSNVTIPESVYMEYIGEENNAITVIIEELAIYYGYKTRGIGYETDFSKKDGKYYYMYECVTIFPWEDVDIYWTKERILKEAERLIEDKYLATIKRTKVPENIKEFD